MHAPADPAPTGARSTAPPLVVDLDGTLLRGNLLVETVVRTVRRAPAEMLLLPWRLLQGRAAFKQMMAERGAVAVEHLPYHGPLLDHLRAEHAAGRRLVLATAADALLANRVAAHLGLFEAVLSSDGVVNLKGAAKCEAIRAYLGDRFTYAGDSPADRVVWRAASGAILVGVSQKTVDQVQKEAAVEHVFPCQRAGIDVWLRALRVHQWTKNLLLFVPLLTAFALFDADALVRMTTAFFAFSLAASATYLINDLWDLDNDRAHPRKRNRPLASGAISILHGAAVAGTGLAVAMAIALAVSPGFAAMLLVYLGLTTGYSMVFKGYVLIDVILLAMLYTFRIFTGAVVAQVPLTPWLLAFSMFLFFSLALVKRCAELVSLSALDHSATKGRDYRVTDLMVLWPFGVGAALSAVVVFCIYISQIDMHTRYAAPELLWIVAIGLIYWLARLWVKTSRDEMHDDPILFALRDRGSRIVIAAMVGVTLAAQWLPIDVVR